MSSGLGELAEEPKAIFWQKSKMTANEFALISMVTLREQLLKKLKKCISDVKNNFRDLDLACITETFQLVHAVRESTYDLVEGVQAWQQGFTKNIRPQLMSVDYLVELIDCMQFFGQSGLRRTFIFTTGLPGNIFLLPMPAMAGKKPPNRCDEALMSAVQNFANPDEARIIRCLKILQNSLPPHEFKRIMPLPMWFNNKWEPNVVLVPREKALEWFKVSDGLDADVVKQTSFLRRKRRNKLGQVIDDEQGQAGAGAGAQDATSTGAAGGGTVVTTSAAVTEGATATTSTATATTATAATATATEESAVKVVGKEKEKEKDKSGKKPDGGYGDIVDPETGKVNTAAIIAQQFGNKDPASFGSTIVVKKEFTKVKNYRSEALNAFNMDKLFNWDDIDDDLPKQKKVNAMAEALKAKEARENRAKGYEEQEAERIREQLRKLKDQKGMGSMRPPSPPKTIEERNERLAKVGISTAILVDAYKAERGLPPNTMSLAEQKKLARAKSAVRAGDED
jgi:hypothetical protein